MTDIVERLRDTLDDWPVQLCREAADEIERLRADKAAISAELRYVKHRISQLRGENPPDMDAE